MHVARILVKAERDYGEARKLANRYEREVSELRQEIIDKYAPFPIGSQALLPSGKTGAVFAINIKSVNQNLGKVTFNTVCSLPDGTVERIVTCVSVL